MQESENYRERIHSRSTRSSHLVLSHLGEEPIGGWDILLFGPSPHLHVRQHYHWEIPKYGLRKSFSSRGDPSLIASSGLQEIFKSVLPCIGHMRHPLGDFIHLLRDSRVLNALNSISSFRQKGLKETYTAKASLDILRDF